MTDEGTGVRIERDQMIRPNPRSTFRELAEGSGGVLLHLDTAAYHGLNPRPWATTSRRSSTISGSAIWC